MENELKQKMIDNYQIAQDLGYVRCMTDVMNYINAAIDENGKVDAEYLKTVLTCEVSLLKTKNAVA